MAIQGFTEEDFKVFTIDGLDQRMDAIKTIIRPKFETLSQIFTDELSVLTNSPIYPHIAKHARRTINPPNDTWISFSSNPRGYKMQPHFQIGLWETHVFIWFAVIYEAKGKEEIGKRLSEQTESIKNLIPSHIEALTSKLIEAGVKLDIKEDTITVTKSNNSIRKW